MALEKYTPQRCIEHVTLFDVPLEVHFDFYKGYEATEFEPPFYDDIEIENVYVDEICILHLMGDNALKELEKKLYKIVDGYGEYV